MSTALQIHASGIKLPVSLIPCTTKQISRASKRVGRIRCSATTPNKKYTIAVLPGDGIGTEVTPVAVEALRLAGSLEGIDFEFKEMLVGGAAYEATGVPFPEETLKASLESDAVYLGAVGITKKMPSSDHLPKHLRPEVGLMRIRRALGVYANLRPITVFPQLLEASSLKRSVTEEVDFMIIRELAGGLYYGKPRGFGINEKGEETGFCTEIYSSSEVDRVGRIAFDMAMERRGKVCSVDKATVLESSRLWRKRVTIMSEEYPEVDLSHMLVDTSAMELIRYPKQFDVLLTTNVFGDILSDVAAMITGGIGMLPSACIGGPGPQLFEPVHGSAPDIEGEDVANPLAAVLTAVMLLRYGLKEEAVAKRIENAIFDTLNEGFRTRDIPTPGAKIVGCKKMGEEILKSLYVRVPSYQLN
ncbi:unnamed protein product [Brassica oleracea]|uniref:3-isopropylmalate dehydrogenase n=1 Tax=Brassica carinata TaxID=52824 RepID=A0A8X7R5N5_BRACI|nr:hypothetical protein Bca52824_053426 [Brassica carinata]